MLFDTVIFIPRNLAQGNNLKYGFMRKAVHYNFITVKTRSKCSKQKDVE